MKYLLGLVLLAGCAGKEFYVQQSSKLTKVVVHECSVVTFENVDTGKEAKREVCRDVTMNKQQKMDWEHAQVHKREGSDLIAEDE